MEDEELLEHFHITIDRTRKGSQVEKYIVIDLERKGTKGWILNSSWVGNYYFNHLLFLLWENGLSLFILDIFVLLVVNFAFCSCSINLIGSIVQVHLAYVTIVYFCLPIALYVLLFCVQRGRYILRGFLACVYLCVLILWLHTYDVEGILWSWDESESISFQP